MSTGVVETQLTRRRTTIGTRTFALLLGTALLCLYLATGEYTHHYGADPFTNAAQARAFADDQDPILEELAGFDEYNGVLAWFTESPRGTTAQYPPGTALWAAPLYLLDSSVSTIAVDHVTDEGQESVVEFNAPSTLAPATVASALSVAIAMTFLFKTISRLMTRRAATVATIVAGLGTGAWSVAADKLWQHGPAMMCISVGTYFASRDRYAFSGLAFGAGVLVRPHTAVIAASIGLAISISRRSVRPAFVMGVASALGLVALVLYNDFVFGGLSVSGGYSGEFADRVVGGSPLVLAQRLVGSLIHARVGILWTSPVVGVALVALVARVRSLPAWSVGGAVGGFLYLVIQYRANRLTGGSGFFSYRYPLEALMAAAPAMAFATWYWIGDSIRRRRVLAVAAALSILAHGIGSVLPTNPEAEVLGANEVLEVPE